MVDDKRLFYAGWVKCEALLCWEMEESHFSVTVATAQFMADLGGRGRGACAPTEIFSLSSIEQ